MPKLLLLSVSHAQPPRKGRDGLDVYPGVIQSVLRRREIWFDLVEVGKGIMLE